MKRFTLTLLLLLTALISMPSERSSKPKTEGTTGDTGRSVAAAPHDAGSEGGAKSLDLVAIAVMTQ